MNYSFNLGINQSLHLLAIGFSILWIRKSNISNLFIHSKLSHQVIGYIIGLL